LEADHPGNGVLIARFSTLLIAGISHALRARGLVDNVNVREPLKPLGDGADAEIRAAVKASGLTVLRAAVAA
jgi:dihydrodipicolinate synthase/N-acetylneuraminate lyase